MKKKEDLEVFNESCREVAEEHGLDLKLVTEVARSQYNFARSVMRENKFRHVRILGFAVFGVHQKSYDAMTTHRKKKRDEFLLKQSQGLGWMQEVPDKPYYGNQ